MSSEILNGILEVKVDINGKTWEIQINLVLWMVLY